MNRKIKVMGRTINFTIQAIDSDEMGVASLKNGYIRVNNNQREEEQKQTFLHELLHIIEETNNSIPDLTEVQIEQLATGLYSFMRENKKLVEWILNE